jgi:hypothetical protein
MEMVESSASEEAVKALYAVSAVIRNFPLAQEQFYFEGGAGLLEVKFWNLFFSLAEILVVLGKCFPSYGFGL